MNPFYDVNTRLFSNVLVVGRFEKHWFNAIAFDLFDVYLFTLDVYT